MMICDRCSRKAAATYAVHETLTPVDRAVALAYDRMDLCTDCAESFRRTVIRWKEPLPQAKQVSNV